MKIVLFGEPIAKQRHRQSRGRTYNPQIEQERAAKASIAIQLAQITNGNDRELQGQLKEVSEAEFFHIELEFHCKPPQSDLWGLKQNGNKQDVDNLCKFYLDCCNSILYSDDHKIVDLRAIKCYSPFPKTILDIYPMNPNDMTSAELKTLNIFNPDEMKEFLEDIGVISQYQVDDLNELDKRGIDEWTHEVACLQYNFACKWSQKLNKIAKK